MFSEARELAGVTQNMNIGDQLITLEWFHDVSPGS